MPAKNPAKKQMQGYLMVAHSSHSMSPLEYWYPTLALV